MKKNKKLIIVAVVVGGLILLQKNPGMLQNLFGGVVG